MVSTETNLRINRREFRLRVSFKKALTEQEMLDEVKKLLDEWCGTDWRAALNSRISLVYSADTPDGEQPGVYSDWGWSMFR
ncbi:MAG: hypothetical protein ACE5OZ_22245 [Candidatus Heimdallarchaeota archaeon]